MTLRNKVKILQILRFFFDKIVFLHLKTVMLLINFGIYSKNVFLWKNVVISGQNLNLIYKFQNFTTKKLEFLKNKTTNNKKMWFSDIKSIFHIKDVVYFETEI